MDPALLKQHADAAESLLHCRMSLASYGAQLHFPSSPPPGSPAANASAILKEWTVAIDGEESQAALLLAKLGIVPMGSYRMQLYMESKAKQEEGLRMLGAGCFSMTYTQPYFEVIAKQFKKPEYVPAIRLTVEPVSFSVGSTNGDGVELEGKVAVISAVMQKASATLQDIQDPQRRLAALNQRLTSSHAPLGSFEFISTYIVDAEKYPVTATPATAPDSAVINTSLYSIRNGFLFTLSLEVIKEVHAKYLPELLGRLGNGLTIVPSSVISAAYIRKQGISSLQPAQRIMAKTQPYCLPPHVPYCSQAALPGSDFALSQHKRVQARSKDDTYVSFKAPLEWAQLPSADVPQPAIAIDPCTKRVAIYGKAEVREVEPSEAEGAVARSFEGTLFRFVTTPNGYSTDAMLRPEMVTIITGQATGARAMCEAFAASLTTSSGTSGWVETKDIATARRFVLWRDIDSTARFVADECRVFKCEGLSAIAIVRTIRPLDYSGYIRTLGKGILCPTPPLVQFMSSIGGARKLFYQTASRAPPGSLLTTPSSEVLRLLKSLTLVVDNSASVPAMAECYHMGTNTLPYTIKPAKSDPNPPVALSPVVAGSSCYLPLGRPVVSSQLAARDDHITGKVFPYATLQVLHRDRATLLKQWEADKAKADARRSKTEELGIVQGFEEFDVVAADLSTSWGALLHSHMAIEDCYDELSKINGKRFGPAMKGSEVLEAFDVIRRVQATGGPSPPPGANPVRWRCFSQSALPNPAESGVAKVPPTAEDSFLLLLSASASLLLIPEGEAAPPVALAVRWTFVSNFETDHQSADVGLWPEGPEAFVRDWDGMRAILKRFVTEELMLPRSL